MWSKGNLERGFEIEFFNMCYCPSGFRVCDLKPSNLTPIYPNQARYHLRYTRIFSFSAMIAEGKEKSKFNLSVVIPVVKTVFCPV